MNDPRLEKLLGVRYFRLAPAADDSDKERALPAVRFPRWLQCPQCNRVAEADDWLQDVGDADRWCGVCTGQRAKKHRVFVVPVRFVVACEKGHLDEFPWDTWVAHKDDCQRKRGPRHWKLESMGAGIGGLHLMCTRCEAKRSLEDAFDKRKMRGLCTGRQPWLGLAGDKCTATPMTLQRGASNMYFPLVESSLLVPPWNDDMRERFGNEWPEILTLADDDERRGKIRLLLQRKKVDIPADWDEGEFIEGVIRRVASLERVGERSLREEEWDRLEAGSFSSDDSPDFETRPEPVADHLAPLIRRVVRVVRLRELRALCGFTRIVPPAGRSAPNISKLSSGSKGWLPAVEVRGEGIFIALDEKAVRAWEVQAEVCRRVQIANDSFREEYTRRYGDGVQPERTISPRLILVHTAAHAVIRQLSLECGYSTASLRERLYAGPAGCGFLIYTATADADGTLGGLQRQGDTERAGELVRGAMRAQRWCSSDPLCIAGSMSASNPTSGAACHSCVIAPETSCEEFNRFLDRAFLVGTPQHPELGFFRELSEPSQT